MYQSTLNGISNEHLYSKKVSSTKNIQCQICPVRTQGLWKAYLQLECLKVVWSRYKSQFQGVYFETQFVVHRFSGGVCNTESTAYPIVPHERSGKRRNT